MEIPYVTCYNKDKTSQEGAYFIPRNQSVTHMSNYSADLQPCKASQIGPYSAFQFHEHQ